MSGAAPAPGLQPERTLLAWRRTALSLGLASLVAARLTLERLGLVALGVGILGLLLSGAAYLAATRRYRRPVGAGILTPAGTAAALLAAATLVTGVLAAWYLVQP